MKYKPNSPFGGHFGRHLEFQYEESSSRLGTRARKFAHCIVFNIKLANLFSGGGGTKIFFCSTGFCTKLLIMQMVVEVFFNQYFFFKHHHLISKHVMYL